MTGTMMAGAAMAGVVLAGTMMAGAAMAGVVIAGSGWWGSLKKVPQKYSLIKMACMNPSIRYNH
jgi:hypothetical protein